MLKIMKRVLLLFAAIFMTTTLAVAQSDDSGIFASFGVTYGGAVGNRNQTYTAHSWDLEFGYQLTDRLSIHMPFSGTINLFDNYSYGKDYSYNSEIGGGLSVVVIKFRESSKIEAKAQCGVSISDCWRYRYYDTSLIWNFGGPYFGLGYRYQDTYRGSYGKYSDFYATFGYRIFRELRHK